MEYALWDVPADIVRKRPTGVLILVLMEYALWEQVPVKFFSRDGEGLNPCFNGICSLSLQNCNYCSYLKKRLNPCFNGICSLSLGNWSIRIIPPTKCLNPCFNGICSLSQLGKGHRPLRRHVLILVLMEYALWEIDERAYIKVVEVLILVLMEYALWAFQTKSKQFKFTNSINHCFNVIWSLSFNEIVKSLMIAGLNPCFNGICSLSANKFLDRFKPVES